MKSYVTDTFDSTCWVHNTDNGKDVIADILDFYPGKHLIISIEKVAKVTLKYNSMQDCYIGSSAGLEFISSGPNDLSKPKGVRR